MYKKLLVILILLLFFFSFTQYYEYGSVNSQNYSVLSNKFTPQLSGSAAGINSSQYIFISNGNSTISAINAQNSMNIQYISVGVNAKTSGVTVTPNGSLILVGTSNDQGMKVINTVSMRIIANVSTASTPNQTNITVSPDGKFAYVNGKNSFNVSVVSLIYFKVVKVLNVSYDPGKMILSQNGTMGITLSQHAWGGETSHNLTEINLLTNSIIQNLSINQLNDPFSGAISPNGSILAVANSLNEEIIMLKFAPTGFSYIYSAPVMVIYPYVQFDLNYNLLFISGDESGVLPGAYLGAWAEIYNSNFIYCYSINLTRSNISTVNGVSLSASGQSAVVGISNPDGIINVDIKKNLASYFLELGTKSSVIFNADQLAYFPTLYSRTVEIEEKGFSSGTEWKVSLDGLSKDLLTQDTNFTTYYGSISYQLTPPIFYIFHNPYGSIHVNYTTGVFSFNAYYSLNQSQSSNYLISSCNLTDKGSTVVSTVNNTFLTSLPTGECGKDNAITPNGTLLLTLNVTGKNSTVNFFSFQSMKSIQNITLKENTGGSNFVAVNPDGLFAYVGSCTYNISVISLKTLSFVGVINVSYDPSSMAFTPNGTMAYVTSGQNINGGPSQNISVLNTLSNKLIATIVDKNLSYTYSDAVSPNGSILAVSSCGNLSLFNTRTLAQEKNFQETSYCFEKVVFNENGSDIIVLTSSNVQPNDHSLKEISLANYSVRNITSFQISGSTFAITENDTSVYCPVENGLLRGFEEFNLSNGKPQATINGILQFGGGNLLIPSSSYTGQVLFSENGLPSGSLWSVILNGMKYSSHNSSITAYSYTGLKNYSVLLPEGYIALNNLSGIVSVSSSESTVNIQAGTGVTFNETGLGLSPLWYLNITGVGISGPIHNSTYSTDLSSGSYQAVATSPFGLNYYLNFTVSSTGNHFAIRFTEAFNFTVNETGISGTLWYLNVTNSSGHYYRISGNAMNLILKLANGSYNFSISISNKTFRPSIYSGAFVIHGTAITRYIKFNPVNFTITFEETGLPAGTSWAINLQLSYVSGGLIHFQLFENSSTGNKIIFNETNNSYRYYIGEIPGYHSNQSSGNITVNGNNVTVNIVFLKTIQVAHKYNVTFIETGLPEGTEWSVTFNGETQTSSNSTIIFNAVNGIYSYKITSIKGFKISSNESGNISITNHNLSIEIAFTKEPGNFNIGGFEIYIIIAVVLMAVVAGTYIFIRRK